MEEEGHNKFDRDSKFSGGSWRNGGRQVSFITLFCFISILQNLSEEWRERDRINLTETLNSLEAAGGMEEDMYVYYIILFYFNPSKSFGGMEVEGENKFDRDSKFSGGCRRNGGRQVCLITLFCCISIRQNLLEEWRERDEKNLTETLNSLVGPGGMEEDKYILSYYFVLFQSSKIYRRNGGRGTE